MVIVEIGEQFDRRSPPARIDRVVNVVRIIVGGVVFTTECNTKEQAIRLAVQTARALGLDGVKT